MTDVENVISNKYDQLLIQHDTIGIKLSSILEKDELQIVTESGEQL